MIATHEEYPIERMRLDRRGKWLGSVSHDDCMKLTDVGDLFEDSEGEGEGASGKEGSESDAVCGGQTTEEGKLAVDGAQPDSTDEEMDEKVRKKKKKKADRGMGDLGRREQTRDTDNGFFDEL